MNGASSTRTTTHKGESVHGVERTALLAMADGSLTGVVRGVQLVKGVVLQLPGGVPVRHVDPLLAHALPELVCVVAQWTLEEVACGQGQRSQTATMEDTVAAVILHSVTGELEAIPTYDAGVVFKVPVLVLAVVSVTEGFEGAQELRETTTLLATGQVEDPTTARLGTVDAGVPMATVPAYLERGESVRERDGDEIKVNAYAPYP